MCMVSEVVLNFRIFMGGGGRGGGESMLPDPPGVPCIVLGILYLNLYDIMFIDYSSSIYSHYYG